MKLFDYMNLLQLIRIMRRDSSTGLPRISCLCLIHAGIAFAFHRNRFFRGLALLLPKITVQFLVFHVKHQEQYGTERVSSKSL